MPASDAADSAPRRRPLVMAVTGAVIAVPIAVTGLFGGLNGKPGGPPRARVGSVVDQGSFRVQVLDARAGIIKTSSFDTGKNRLIVRMRVTNTTKESMGVTTFSEGVVAEPKRGTTVDPDPIDSNAHIGDVVSSELDPDLPVNVELVWLLPAHAAPASTDIDLRKWAYGQSFTTNTFGWTVGKTSPLAAQVSVPIRQGATR